jgi:C1A family cysteine protease
LGTCWTFAANAVIETQLLRTGRGEWNLSEKNMTLLCGFEGDWNLGGNNDMAAAHLLRWAGAVAETNDVYFTHANSYYDVSSARDEWENARPSHPLDPALHIQNVVWVPALDGTETARNELKAAIMEYGAVAVAARWTGISQKGCSAYYNGSDGCDHAITVIGWDDNWPTNNFAKTPPGDGAWIIKNSWGTDDGTAGGYWYVSYYDTRFGTDNNSVFLPATAEENYTAVYGYDKFGYIYDFATEHADAFDPFDLMAAVFTSGWNEELAAVGLYSLVTPCPYEISIYTNVTRNAATPTANGTLACQMTGTLPHAGFTTIPLPSPIPLADHTTFSVVYRQTGSERSNPLCCTWINYCYPNLAPGQSYFGYSGTNGEEDIWIDGADKDIVNQVDNTDKAWAACIKAYTRSTVPAKAGDAPGETADGTEALAALAATNALAYAQHGETFGAFANIVGANGRTLWANWLAGLDPADPEDDFLVSIAVTNGVPSLSWKPDLGASRNYTIFGRYALSPESGWEVVQANKLATTTNRFFKVSLSPR